MVEFQANWVKLESEIVNFRAKIVAKHFKFAHIWSHWSSSQSSIYGNSSFGYPKWDLLIALYAGWLLVFLMTMKGMELLSKIIYVSAVVPIVLLFTILLWKAPYNGVAILHVLTIDPAKLLSLNLWMKAGSYSIKSICHGIGIITCLASHNRYFLK